jgi:hypothetical protein
MTRSSFAAVVFLALGLATPALSQDGSGDAVQTVASFDSPAFLENLIVEPDQSIILTSYLDRTLRSVTASGQVTTVATLPAHPVGIVRLGDGFLISAHGASFTEGPAFTSTNQVLVLNGQGRVVNTVAAPDARFLNGMVEIGPDAVLIADSIAGLIWRFTPSSGALAPWLSDERLTLNPKAQPFRPAANGLKLHDGRLFVSNSSRGTLHSVGLSASLEPEGELTLLAAPGPVDDFAFGPDGVLYGATHGETLIAVTPEGAVFNVMDEGCDSCTSVAVVGDRLIVLTTGNLVEGGTGPARILSIAIP